MISVCITTYNGERYVMEQLESILTQLGENDEVIIGDDGSTDGTLEIIDSFQDDRIKIFRNNFHNHILNFEDCIKRAEGEIIFLSDQDDVWLPGKVETMTEALEDVDLVCSNCYVTDGDLNHSGELFFYDDPSKKPGVIKNFWHNQYVGCCIAFKRGLLRYALPFPKGLITHDTWLGLVADVTGKSKFIGTPLILFRRHGNNVSSTGEKSRLSVLQMIGYRLTIVKGLIRNCLTKRK
ncbi:MAG: glycosyltransferase family 2 protein [Muribaculaceae bacterium]|nr:glycosyltransferase family 2 protein [Muribaculaceae bacterium]